LRESRGSGGFLFPRWQPRSRVWSCSWDACF
jgi:hypothetical protein